MAGKGGYIPGSGRKKGVPNKLTADVRQAIINAFHKAGGEKYLLTVAQEDPKVFCTLLGKIVPAEVKATIDVSGTLAEALAEARKQTDADS